ncbi:unnamed protein product, partial [Iphiclides podalirius]
HGSVMCVDAFYVYRCASERRTQPANIDTPAPPSRRHPAITPEAAAVVEPRSVESPFEYDTGKASPREKCDIYARLLIDLD